MTHIAAGREQRLREDADFRRYWWARQLSTTGNIITLIALPVLVYRLSGSAFLTALTSALEAAPYMLFGLFAGALSDRWDRRLVMINADLANAALAASVPVAYWLGALTVPHVLIVAFGGPAIGVFFDGANFGALPLLVGRERIAQANAVVFGSAAAVETVMPSLVGIGLAVVHPADLLAVDAVSFAASALLLRGITRALHDRARERPRLSRTVLFGDIREGLAFLMRHDGVRTMTIVTAIQSFAGGGFVALMVVWCDRVLGVGTEGWRFGLVYTGWAVGAVVAAVALPRMLRRAAPAQIALLALPLAALFGVSTAGLATSWPVAATGLLLWSIFYSLVIINSISYRQQVTPENLLGRVNTAGRMLAWGVGWTLGALVGGVLGGLIGVRAALVVMTALGFVAVLVAWTSPLRVNWSGEHAREDQPATDGGAVDGGG
ncbi:MAG: MFS transporter [Nocardioidaceae bacterium]|nr:MFS transporter [Nocardioidaceae bacterium]